MDARTSSRTHLILKSEGWSKKNKNWSQQKGKGETKCTCNPSYSGGRNQGDRGTKPAWGNSLWDWVAQGVGHQFKPKNWKEKKKGGAKGSGMSGFLGMKVKKSVKSRYVN
jgi:hypothetical protein